MGTTAVDVRVRGRVQGVSFRMYAEQRAAELGVAGWVRNEPDGSVAVRVEGDQEAVDAFDIGREPEHIRALYGNGVHGRQTLIARRLLERGSATSSSGTARGSPGTTMLRSRRITASSRPKSTSRSPRS